eukprot:TRINITY_DN10764_c0_g1_i1.p1 TRINITY_DN10764_c0_g1~~TRINITY_DN10764_c0_g1_i1.p1  ORF type:complete len:522 (-),score=117.59 TRINITY_DN10764_c0_g1_i1:114-1679(-)
MGGIGIFLVQTGLEASTGLVLDESSWSDWFDPSCVKLWGSAMALVLVHRLCHSTRLSSSPLFDPAFFLSIPAVFYLVALALGYSIQQLRAQDWLYESSDRSSPDFFLVWKAYTPFDSIQWSLLGKQIPTILGLGFFSLLHVPLNVPLMAALTGTNVDIDKEFRCHGYSNLLAGATGTLQNYLVYCNSALYRNSGGDGLASSLAVLLGTLVMMGCGSAMIGFVPRMLAGCMMAQLGVAFVEDALLASRRALAWSELLTILTIMASMAAIGFLEGVAIGIGLACLLFVVESSRGRVVRRTLNGASLSSSVRWPARQERKLREARRGVRVLQLQGHLFFGSIGQLREAVQAMSMSTKPAHSQASFLACPESEEADVTPVQYLILDLELVVSADFSGCKAMTGVLEDCKERGCTLVLCNGSPKLCKQLHRTDRALADLEMLPDLATSLFWCETHIATEGGHLFPAPTASLVECLGELCSHSSALSLAAAWRLPLWRQTTVFKGRVARQLQCLSSVASFKLSLIHI